MKKIIGLFIILSFFSFSKNPDDGILFKIAYMPETKYSETLEQSSQTNILYRGDEEILERLEDKGIKNPTVTDKSSKTIAEIKTGKIVDGTHFPVVMNFISTTSSDGKKTIPDGSIVYAKCTLDSMPTVDSADLPGLDDYVKQVAIKTMGSLFTLMNFPAKRLHIGDTLIHEIPLTIPAGVATIKMKIQTIYKLISIDNGIANLDMTQTYNMTLDEYTTEGSGSGKGVVKYDIAHKFYSYYQEAGEMKLKMKLKGLGMDLSSKNSYTQSFSFSNN